MQKHPGTPQQSQTQQPIGVRRSVYQIKVIHFFNSTIQQQSVSALTTPSTSSGATVALTPQEQKLAKLVCRWN